MLTGNYIFISFSQLQDVKDAPLSLLREHSKKITEQGGGRKSLVKTIIIGSVPDRGGRAYEMRPKAADIRPNFGGFNKASGGGSGHKGDNGGGGGGNRGNSKRGRY